MSKTISSVIIRKRERDKFAWNGIGPLLEESRIGKIRRWREGRINPGRTSPGRACENQQKLRAGNDNS